MEIAMPLINRDIDRQGELMLLAARTAWASSPNKIGALKAIKYIRQIDPASSSFVAAQALIEEIKSRNISNLDFETKHKYETEPELRALTLEVIRDIGVAYGKVQKPSHINFEWITH